MKTDTVSPELGRALNALRGEIRDTDSPVGAARAVRRVAARFPLKYHGQRKAFLLEAEKLLVPHFGFDAQVPKAVAWLAVDAAWEAPRTWSQRGHVKVLLDSSGVPEVRAAVREILDILPESVDSL